MDEVPEKKLRTRVLNNFTSFVDQVRGVLKGNLRVIGTTRPHGYSQEFEPARFLHLTIQKLSSKNAFSYAKLWTDARETNPKETQRILDTFKMCLNDEVVKVLTQTPLQVTILLVIIRARGTPPKQREELFERYMDIIYQREQKNRPELLRTEQDIIYGLHRYLAYILHTRVGSDRTAALMDVSEFREKVNEYLFFSNPLLTQDELQTKVNQIITEASQRLVLIESPEVGKLGFDLTTTREFFAAAHLVDTAKDTKERDLRFKAIAKSPHWRNVVLFFAGRVGRTRPGEAPSMIDVCRDIDTERADKLLKRGAELVMEMIEDRVLREPHNEVGAIQYGLKLLDNRLARQSRKLTNQLKSLSDEYKERVVKPWLEERLENVIPEKVDPHCYIYQQLFGITDPLKLALQRASLSHSPDVKLSALTMAIENKVNEPWVISLVEELVNIIPIEEIAWRLQGSYSNIIYYLDFSLSSKARGAFAIALLTGMETNSPPFEALSSEDIDILSKIKPDGGNKENSLLLWAASQLAMMSRMSVAEYRRVDYQVGFDLPSIGNPKLKSMVSRKATFIKEFCKTFSNENEPFHTLLLAVFEYLLEPYNLEKCIDIQNAFQKIEKPIQLFISRIISSLIGILPEDKEAVCEYHKDLVLLYEHYSSEQQYRKDIEEFNDIITKDSKKVKNHPYRLLVWIDSYCDPATEKFLDSEIVSKAKDWFQYRGFSKHIPRFFSMDVRDVRDLELLEAALIGIERALKDRKVSPRLYAMLSMFRWHEPKTKKEVQLGNRLKCLFEKILESYSNEKYPEPREFGLLYWSALTAGVVEEKHMAELYKMAHNNQNIFFRLWFRRMAENVRSALLSMLQSVNQESSRFAAVSLSEGFARRFMARRGKYFEEIWVAEKFWEFARDKEDTYRSTYITGMAQCRLEWAKHSEEWLEAIKEEKSKELEIAWSRVIGYAGYCTIEDGHVLLELLLQILESEDTYPEVVRYSALRRLNEIVFEIEPEGFDEEPLNLPLSRRTRALVA